MQRIQTFRTPRRYEVHYQQMHTGQMFIYRFRAGDVVAEAPAHPLLVKVLAVQVMQGRLDTFEAKQLFGSALGITATAT